YTSESFDFIALKLAPTEGVQDMRPVRVVTPGADPTLPLRMVAAGVGANVGLELYVLSEGRYHPSNFPDATIDFTKLAWDPTASRSNYSELATGALAANGGTGWLTESSQPANLYGFSGPNPPLGTTYESTCRLTTVVPVSCGMQAGDAGVSQDAASEGNAAAQDGGGATADGSDGAAVPEAASSMFAGDASPCPSRPLLSCDDLSLAMTGIATGNLWVTRLRAALPVGALSQDLVLGATASQAPVSNAHHTNSYTIANYDPCAG